MHSQSFSQLTKASQPSFQSQLTSLFHQRQESLRISPVKQGASQLDAHGMSEKLRQFFTQMLPYTRSTLLLCSPYKTSKPFLGGNSSSNKSSHPAPLRTLPLTPSSCGEPPDIPASPFFPPSVSFFPEAEEGMGAHTQSPSLAGSDRLCAALCPAPLSPPACWGVGSLLSFLSQAALSPAELI